MHRLVFVMVGLLDVESPLAIDHRFALCRVAASNRRMCAIVTDMIDRGNTILPIGYSCMEVPS